MHPSRRMARDETTNVALSEMHKIPVVPTPCYCFLFALSPQLKALLAHRFPQRTRTRSCKLTSPSWQRFTWQHTTSPCRTTTTCRTIRTCRTTMISAPHWPILPSGMTMMIGTPWLLSGTKYRLWRLPRRLPPPGKFFFYHVLTIDPTSPMQQVLPAPSASQPHSHYVVGVPFTTIVPQTQGTTTAAATIICRKIASIPPGYQAAAILQCGVCMSPHLYARKADLKRHMEIHLPATHFCHVNNCPRGRQGNGFTRVDKLSEHLTKMHGLQRASSSAH